MYIDSLTIAAGVVFVIALAALIRFCIVGICGMSSADDHNKVVDKTHDVQS
jgi:hypothetical protein